jgi:phosphate starvation-inducible PhoH-like protein
MRKKPVPPQKPYRAPRLQPVKISFQAQTVNQEKFIDNIKSNVVSFAVGSPGTGKTFLAVACALEMLLNQEVKKIIITRPTVPAGPDIGFLPGDVDEKLSPWLVPIFDAISKLIPKSLAEDLMGMGKIEIAPITFVRGRNFEDCFVIVDEAENLDRKSFYLLLTRLCDGSKMVFSGDSSQIDLKNVFESGLVDAVHKFKNKENFSVTEFTIEDCRRSAVVQEVIKAYFSELNNSKPKILEPIHIIEEPVVDHRVPVKPKKKKAS